PSEAPFFDPKLGDSSESVAFLLSEVEISIFPLKMSEFDPECPTSEAQRRASDLGVCQSEPEISVSDGGGGSSGVGLLGASRDLREEWQSPRVRTWFLLLLCHA